MTKKRKAKGGSTTKRYVDLSHSARSKIIMYKSILNKLKLRDFKPDAVMKMLKIVCEKRNKAVQGEAMSNAE